MRRFCGRLIHDRAICNQFDKWIDYETTGEPAQIMGDRLIGLLYRHWIVEGKRFNSSFNILSFLPVAANYLYVLLASPNTLSANFSKGNFETHLTVCKE